MSLEPTNTQRAEWSLAGLRAFAQGTQQIKDLEAAKTDAEKVILYKEIMHDFLTDLMHLCDRLDVRFATLVESASNCHDEEVRLDPP